jgi:FeS assembly protein SufD
MMSSQLLGNPGEPAWMRDFRKYAFTLFQTMPDSQWRYGLNISSKSIQDLPVLLTREPVSLRHNVPEGVIFCDLSMALQKHPNLVQKYFMKIVKPTTKELAHHAAFWTRGIFLYVPRNTNVQIPLTAAYPGITSQLDHTLIVVEENSSVTFIEETEATMPFRSHVIEVFAHPNAHLIIGEIQNLKKTKQLNTKKAIVACDASVQWLDCCLGSAFTKATIATHLQGPGASTTTWSVFLGDHTQKYDIQAASIHEAPHTSSTIITKGALDDDAKTIYRGLVNIQEKATNSEGYQKEEVLLLSSDAQADVIPDLLIDNNEVQCSHGASIGQLNQEMMFYMMSRGLSAEESKLSIIEGFFQPMIDKIHDGALQNHIQDMIQKRLRCK